MRPRILLPAKVQKQNAIFGVERSFRCPTCTEKIGKGSQLGAKYSATPPNKPNFFDFMHLTKYNNHCVNRGA